MGNVKTVGVEQGDEEIKGNPASAGSQADLEITKEGFLQYKAACYVKQAITTV